MSFLFGGVPEGCSQTQKKPQSPIKEMRSQLRTGIRTVQREHIKLDQQEQTLVKEIRSYARSNQLTNCHTKAKELVRLRAHKERSLKTVAQLQALHQNLSCVTSTQVMHEAIAKTSKLLQSLHGKMNTVSIMKTMQEFEKNAFIFNESQEMLQEKVDEVMSVDDETSITHDTVEGVLQEIGIDLQCSMPHAKTDAFTDDALAQRLNALKVKSQIQS